MEIDSKLVGRRIMQKRKELDLTQEQLSELIGITSGHLSCIERGHYLPTTQSIYKLCEVLGESPNYYLIGQISTEREEKIISISKKLPESYQIAIEKTMEAFAEAFVNEKFD